MATRTFDRAGRDRWLATFCYLFAGYVILAPWVGMIAPEQRGNVLPIALVYIAMADAQKVLATPVRSCRLLGQYRGDCVFLPPFMVADNLMLA